MKVYVKYDKIFLFAFIVFSITDLTLFDLIRIKIILSWWNSFHFWEGIQHYQLYPMRVKKVKN